MMIFFFEQQYKLNYLIVKIYALQYLCTTVFKIKKKKLLISIKNFINNIATNNNHNNIIYI